MVIIETNGTKIDKNVVCDEFEIKIIMNTNCKIKNVKKLFKFKDYLLELRPI